MKSITRVSNGAIKALVALGLFFNLAIYSTAQEYYYKKAHEYWSIGWKESAVSDDIGSHILQTKRAHSWGI